MLFFRLWAFFQDQILLEYAENRINDPIDCEARGKFCSHKKSQNWSEIKHLATHHCRKVAFFCWGSVFSHHHLGLDKLPSCGYCREREAWLGQIHYPKKGGFEGSRTLDKRVEILAF